MIVMLERMKKFFNLGQNIDENDIESDGSW
jgi:hypothetical protein